MGRLVKAKTDAIAKLRQEGYTQKEVAQRLHVHPRTVRKYDPLHQERLQERSVEDRLSTLEEAVRTSWDWIELFHTAMVRHPGLGSELYGDEYICPRCQGELVYDDEESIYICSWCGHKLSNSCSWCYHCLSQEEMDYVEKEDDFVCRTCGVKRYKRKP